MIDPDRYLVDQPQSDGYQALVAHCRASMAEHGCAHLPGFVSADVVQAMAAELVPLPTFRRSHVLSAWGDPPGEHLPPDHIHRRLFPEDTQVLAGDQLQGTALRQLYESPELMSFLADALSLPALHRFADPFQDLNVVQIADGGLHAWHYDLSDFVITILLQKSEVGGQFEFAPFIRGEVIPGVTGGRDGRVWDERYEDVERLFNDQWPSRQTLDLEPGDLVMFNGLRSMHRVRSVYGATRRMVGVLSYDTKPGFRSTDDINSRLYGPRCEAVIRGQR